MKIKLIFLIVLLGLLWIFFLKKEPLSIVKKQIVVEQNITIEKVILEDTDKIIKENFVEKNTSFVKEENVSDSVQSEEIDEILKAEKEVLENLLEKEEKIRIQMIEEQEHLLELYDLN